MTFFGQIARPGGYRGLEKCSIGCLIHKVRKRVTYNEMDGVLIVSNGN